MKGFILLLFLTLLSTLHANEKEEPTNAKKEGSQILEEALNLEKRWSLFGSFAYLDMWLPGKFGASIAYGNKIRTYELAYQKASYQFDLIIDDLGRISDQRIHLTSRSFTWENSFNFQYGLFYQDLEISLGTQFTRNIGAKYDLLKISTLGGMWGFGNRWLIHPNWSFGIDWFKVFWPMKTVNRHAPFLDETNESDDEDQARELLDTIASVPTFTFLLFELGYRF